MKQTILVLLLLSGCGSMTERQRRDFPVEVVGSTAPIVTDSGWTVTLTRATAHLATLRFFSGPAQVVQGSPPWWHGLVVSTAYAHPGHYVPGEALGEVLTPVDVNLLDANATNWGTADAVTGTYGSVQVGYAPGGLEVEGTATKNGTTVEFSTTFTPPAPLEGASFPHEMTTSKGRVQVTVDLDELFSRVDFGSVGTGAKPLDTMSPAFNGFARGVEDVSVYATTWKDE
ncbi:MAG: hypothetical protein ACO1OB_22310 [Archangium sp.]